MYDMTFSLAGDDSCGCHKKGDNAWYGRPVEGNPSPDPQAPKQYLQKPKPAHSVGQCMSGPSHVVNG